MRILIIGSGGREHAMAWKLSRSPKVSSIFIAPGNGGTARVGENVALKDDDVAGLIAFAREHKVDLVVPGPELPLVLGIVDAMTEAGIPCFGPDAYCAMLEGSKAFAKQVMQASGVPTAEYARFDRVSEAVNFVRNQSGGMVVKADGLAAGKGVVVCENAEEALAALEAIMVEGRFGKAGAVVVIEELLVGEEASFLAFCDGETAVAMPTCQDHKAVGEGDTGANTGGMGAYSPAPLLPAERADEMLDLVIRPVLRHMKAQGHPFKGVLYAGLMLTEDGPKVLEYNTRFGDPECQPLLMRLDSDLVDIMLACAGGRLTPELVRWKDETALCVVVAVEGYPEAYPKGMEVGGLDEAEKIDGLMVFQAGTKIQDGKTVTSGGRVLGVTALGPDLAQAKALAYKGVDTVHFDKSYVRRDIGDKGLRRLGLF